jgi:Ankyrin repeat
MASADDDDESVCSSVESIRNNHGAFGDDDTDVPWNGCVCGHIHARPTPVFWIQCDGPCQAWYNVTPSCVNGLTEQDAANLLVWNCDDCKALRKRSHPSLQLFMDLPPEVFFRILEFTAKPTHRGAVLQTQIASLCKVTRHFVMGDVSKSIWETILEHDYHSFKPTTKNHIKTSPKKQAPPCSASPSSQRVSKRRRKITNFYLNTNSSSSGSSAPLQKSNGRQSVIREHLSLLSRNEDAYVALDTLAEPMASRYRGQNVASYSREQQNAMKNNTHVPLSLQRLRRLVQSFDHPLDVNRPCPFSGRTFLHICCAANLNEAGVVQCVRYLIQEQGADPNVMSTNESPYADRPALFFAIARVMPKLVDLLIKAGASLTIQANGEFRRTFDPSKTIRGCFTPLEYAREIKRMEAATSVAPSSTTVPPYWMNKLNSCIRILAEASSSSN